MKSTNRYPNLRAEMARKQLTITAIAEGIGVRRERVSRWLSGGAFPLDKAIKIRDRFFPGKTLDELYLICETKQEG